MTDGPSQDATQISVNSGSFEVLLEQLAEVIRSDNHDELESFLAAHPDNESQLRGVLPTVQAMVMIGETDETQWITVEESREVGSREEKLSHLARDWSGWDGCCLRGGTAFAWSPYGA